MNLNKNDLQQLYFVFDNFYLKYIFPDLTLFMDVPKPTFKFISLFVF